MQTWLIPSTILSLIISLQSRVIWKTCIWTWLMARPVASLHSMAKWLNSGWDFGWNWPAVVVLLYIWWVHHFIWKSLLHNFDAVQRDERGLTFWAVVFGDTIFHVHPCCVPRTKLSKSPTFHPLETHFCFCWWRGSYEYVNFTGQQSYCLFMFQSSWGHAWCQ